MKHTRYFFALAVAAFVLPSCKSPEPSFGIPDDKPSGFLSRERRDKRADAWHERRASWAKREEQKFNRMFDRMKGDF